MTIAFSVIYFLICLGCFSAYLLFVYDYLSKTQIFKLKVYPKLNLYNEELWQNQTGNKQ